MVHKLIHNCLSFLIVLSALATASAQPLTLWGTTVYGGTTGAGTLYTFEPGTNTYTERGSFEGGTSGAHPYSQVQMISTGQVLIVCSEGTADGSGSIVEFDTATNNVTLRVDFDYSVAGLIYGRLVEAGNGKLYGVSRDGGNGSTGYLGTLFEYDPVAHVVSKKVQFDGAQKGSSPTGTPLLASNGKLYGMTTEGGANNNGTLFEYDPNTNIFTKKVDFEQSTTGSSLASLMQASNGKIYGATSSFGPNGGGVIFEYIMGADSVTVLHALNNGVLGYGIEGKMIEVSPGKLYGVTSSYGSIFEFDYTTNTYTRKASVIGSSPRELYLASDNNLYGTTYSGGSAGDGTLFKYDYVNSVYTKELDFASSFGLTNGAYHPEGILNEIASAPAPSVTTFTKYVSDVKYGKQKLWVATPPTTMANVYVLPQKKPGGTSYTVQVSTTSDFSADVQSLTGSVSADWFFMGLTPGATYYSRANVDGGAYGNIRPFVVESLGSSVLGKTYDPTYGWQSGGVNPTTSTSMYCRPTPVSGASTYTVEVNTDPNFGAATGQTRTGTSWSSIGYYYYDSLQYSTTYYVRVMTDNENVWGATRTFTTEPIARPQARGDRKEATSQSVIATQYEVYPNPFANELFVKADKNQDQKMDIRITDLTGKVIYQLADYSVGQPIVLSGDLAKGIYLLQLQIGDQTEIKKIVKR